VTATQQPPRHSVSVAAAIIDDQGCFLAIRRADNGQWEPPGGVLELDESIEAGLIREVAEETGLTVEPIALTGVYKNMRRGIVALVFRCDIADGVPHTSREVHEIAWLTPDELSDHMSDAYRVRLLDALSRDSPPTVRAHDGANLLASTPDRRA
jgi:8-oxo-dGTP pyrophosphatase MutT (NUDIX family)